MTKNKTLLIKIASAACLIAVAVGWRILNHEYNFAPNLELVTTAAVLAAIILGTRAAIAVPLLAIVLSDMIIGNSKIFIFTWSAFAIIGIGAILLKKLNEQPKKQILASAAFAIASSFLFFLVTNFGVWAQGWYPPTWDGIVTCFTLAIPFYRTMLIGNLILVPSTVATWHLVKSRLTAKQTSDISQNI